MNQQAGNGSLCFSKTPFIISTASVVGKKEGEGPLKDCFDVIGKDKFNFTVFAFNQFTIKVNHVDSGKRMYP